MVLFLIFQLYYSYMYHSFKIFVIQQYIKFTKKLNNYYKKYQLFYTLDKFNKSSMLKNKLKIIAMTVAKPLPERTTSLIDTSSPLIPTTKTVHVKIRFCELL